MEGDLIHNFSCFSSLKAHIIHHCQHKGNHKAISGNGSCYIIICSATETFGIKVSRKLTVTKKPGKCISVWFHTMVVKWDCITFAGRINKSITLVLHSTNNNLNDFALHSANMRGQPWLADVFRGMCHAHWSEHCYRWAPLIFFSSAKVRRAHAATHTGTILQRVCALNV